MNDNNVVLDVTARLTLTESQVANLDKNMVFNLVQALRALSLHLSIRPSVERAINLIQTDAEIMKTTASAIELLNERLKVLEDHQREYGSSHVGNPN